MDDSLTDVVSALTEMASVDPERARRAALTESVTADDPLRIQLLAIAAEASLRVGAVADALELFNRAGRLAEACGDPDAGPLQVRAATMTALTGDSDAALALLDSAEAILGDRAWLAWNQRGMIHHWAGRSEEARQWLDRAEPGATAAGDRLTLAKLKMNRALVEAQIGELDAASRDAAAAEQLVRALGDNTLASEALHNRGWIAAQAGDLAQAWRLMHEAAEDESWTAPPVALLDRAELAHAAGLLVEAAELAEAASEAQVAAGDTHGAVTSGLLHARIALDLGDPETALRRATETAALLGQQGRAQLRAGAAAIEIAARRDLTERATHDERVASASAIADAVAIIEAHPWRSIRIEGLLAAGELNLHAGNREEAARLFTLAGADRAGELGPDVHQHAARALAGTARTGVLDDRQLDPAWDELVVRRRIESVYELRGDWGTAPRLLTRVALVPLLDRGDADGAIRWLERLRSLPPGAIHDAQGSEVARALRALWVRRQAASDDVDAEDVAFFAEKEAALEAELVDRARLVEASAPERPVPTAADLAAELGDGQMRWIVALPAGAWSVTLTSANARVERLDRDRLARESTRLVTAMRLGLDDWREAATALDAVLSSDDSCESIVVVPVGAAVEDLSFGALPSLRDKRLRTCWSGAHWLSTRVSRDTSRVTLAGTGVEETNRELDLLAGVWPDAATLRGSSATCANILDAFAADTLVHVGAHGRLRRDNPLLSILECADGPLYGYEITRAGRVPGTVLLWSCALGGVRLPAGVGVAGWPALLAGCGCNALIAAPGALPSGPAPDLAVEVHRGLARGEATDVTLAHLRTSTRADDLAARAAAMLAVHGAG